MRTTSSRFADGDDGLLRIQPIGTFCVLCRNLVQDHRMFVGGHVMHHALRKTSWRATQTMSMTMAITQIPYAYSLTACRGGRCEGALVYPERPTGMAHNLGVDATLGGFGEV